MEILEIPLCVGDLIFGNVCEYQYLYFNKVLVQFI